MTATQANGRKALVTACRAGVTGLLLVVSNSPLSADGLRPWSSTELPALALPSTGGERFTLERLSADTVIVHFFATWCEPCVEELADLDRLALANRGRGLRIVAIDVSEPPVRVAKFLAAHPVQFPVLLDEERVALKAWAVEILPTSFVLGPGLKPRLSAEGPVKWTAPEITNTLAAMPAAGGATVQR